MERPFHRVLARLVTRDALRRPAVPLTLRRAHQVEVLAEVELDAQLVPYRNRGRGGIAQQDVGVHRGEVADQNGNTVAESAGFSNPLPLPMILGEREVSGGPAATRR